MKKNWLLSLLIVLVGAVAAGLILTLQTTQAETEHASAETGAETETAAETAAEPRGPHGGRLLSDRDLDLEVQIYEAGVAPEFRVYFQRAGKALPVKALQLSAEVKRLGKTDRLSFVAERDYLRSQQSVYEPHSFDVSLTGTYAGQRYTWTFQSREGRLEVPPELLKRSGVQVLSAGPRALGRSLRFPGQIALDQDMYVHIAPPLAGVANAVLKHVGEPVRKGEVLAVLNSRELSELRLAYQAQQQETQRARQWLTREKTGASHTRRLLALLKQGQDPEAIQRQLAQTPVGENKALLLTALSELRLARQTLTREQDLSRDRITSQETLQKAQTDYEAALARYSAALEEVAWQREGTLLERQQAVQSAETAQQQLAQKLQVLQVPLQAGAGGSARYEVRSPIDGVITEKHLSVGESTPSAGPIFVVANLKVVWAELQVPDAQLERVRLGQRVRVTAQNGQRQATGVISHTSPVVDPDTRRAEAHAHIDNPDGFWRPGMFITVEVLTDARRVPVAVAKSALQTFRDWTVVYARFGDQFEVRPLKLGAEDGEWVEVLSGLAPGQAYAAQNSFVLKAELGKTTASHDH
ncbi:MAG: efflux RND transporter periplasmic adaptor subunit [Candidatus Sericytochromatia bacterium]